MKPPGDESAVAVVARLLKAARDAGASDLHLDPTGDAVAARLVAEGLTTKEEVNRVFGA